MALKEFKSFQKFKTLKVSFAVEIFRMKEILISFISHSVRMAGLDTLFPSLSGKCRQSVKLNEATRMALRNVDDIMPYGVRLLNNDNR